MRRASSPLRSWATWLWLLPALALPARAAAAGVSGRLESLDSLRIPGLLPRAVQVWLPPGYETGSGRHPVLYAMDGQNLFDPATSFIGVEWGLDETLTALVDSGRVRAPIVVGIGNTPQRHRDYTPSTLFALATPEEQAAFCFEEGGAPLSAAYGDGLVERLLPLVAQRYRTLPGPDNTFLLGSSRGALVSLEILARHPEVFGGALCLSTHWVLCGPHLEAWLDSLLPAPGHHRLYFDHGDQTLDVQYPPFQARVDSLLALRGWNLPQDRLSLSFPGDEHSERSWSRRAHLPLEWLLGRPPAVEGIKQP